MVQTSMPKNKKLENKTSSQEKKIGLLSLFGSINNKFSIAEKYLTIFALLLMVSLVFIQIVLRSFFSLSHPGMEEISRTLMLWSGMMGCAIATRRKFHVTCDILLLLVSKEKTIKIIGVIIEFLCVICCVFFTFWSYSYLSSGIQLNKVTRDLMIHTYWVDSAFLISGFLMVIYFLMHFVSDCIQLKDHIRFEKLNSSLTD